MKKVILTLAAVALMGVANAQLFVGADLGFSMNKGNRTVTTTTSGSSSELSADLPKTIDFGIYPKIGYQLNDRMSFGAIFGFGLNKTTDFTADDILKENYEYSVKAPRWEVCPFFRYNVFNFGAFTMFAELQVPIYGQSGTEEEKYHDKVQNIDVTNTLDAPKTFGFGVQIVPGLSYNLNEHFSFDLYCNLIALGFRTEKVTVTRENGGVTNEGVDKTTDFGLGINSLPNSSLQIGFNYKF